MRKCDVVFSENYSYSLEDAYAKIFECVDENGILCIQDFPDDECEIEGYISCRLKFDEKIMGLSQTGFIQERQSFF